MLVQKIGVYTNQNSGNKNQQIKSKNPIGFGMVFDVPSVVDIPKILESIYNVKGGIKETLKNKDEIIKVFKEGQLAAKALIQRNKDEQNSIIVYLTEYGKKGQITTLEKIKCNSECLTRGLIDIDKRLANPNALINSTNCSYHPNFNSGKPYFVTPSFVEDLYGSTHTKDIPSRAEQRARIAELREKSGCGGWGEWTKCD